MVMLRETTIDGQEPSKVTRIHRRTGERILSHIYAEAGGIRLMEYKNGKWINRKWYPDFCAYLGEWKGDPAQP